VAAITSYLRSLNPGLPRSVQTLQLGGLINFFGSGLAIPFLFIYLHNVRGIGLATAGLILATNGATGLAAGPFAGALVDRVGGRRILAGALVVQALAYAMYPLIAEPWHGFAASAVAGIGIGMFWPAQSSLIAQLTPGDRRAAAFATQRLTMNLGFGLGGLVGGLIATTSDPTTFTVIFLLNSATFLGYIVALVRVPEPERPRTDEEVARGSYRDVLRHRVFIAVLAINVLLITAGIAQLTSFPVYAKNEAALTERAIGTIFFLNTVVIVLAQLPLAKLLEGRRRMPAIGLVGLLWAGSWLLFPAGAGLADGIATAAIFALAIAVFAIGEGLHGVVHAPLVVDLAVPQILGRYLALSSMSWEVGFTVGPALAGVVLDLSPHGLWFLAAAICLAAGCFALALEPRLPDGVLRTPRRSFTGSPATMANAMPMMPDDPLEPLSTSAEPAPHSPTGPAPRSRRSRRTA
jgi:MFS family permease